MKLLLNCIKKKEQILKILNIEKIKNQKNKICFNRKIIQITNSYHKNDFRKKNKVEVVNIMTNKIIRKKNKQIQINQRHKIHLLKQKRKHLILLFSRKIQILQSKVNLKLMKIQNKKKLTSIKMKNKIKIR